MSKKVEKVSRTFSNNADSKAGKEKQAERDFAQMPKCRCGWVLVSREVGDHIVQECLNPECFIGVPEVPYTGSRFEN